MASSHDLTTGGTSFAPFVIKAESLDAAEAKVTEAFKENKFGVIFRISPQEILLSKLGKDIGPYVILGVCNPALGHAALVANPNCGVAVPCNVFIRQSGDDYVVGAIDPAKSLVAHSSDADFAAIASDSSAGISATLEALKAAEE